jgi:hypothetical protein
MHVACWTTCLPGWLAACPPDASYEHLGSEVFLQALPCSSTLGRCPSGSMLQQQQQHEQARSTKPVNQPSQFIKDT